MHLPTEGEICRQFRIRKYYSLKNVFGCTIVQLSLLNSGTRYTIRKSDSVASFKSSLKTYLFENYR